MKLLPNYQDVQIKKFISKSKNQRLTLSIFVDEKFYIYFFLYCCRYVSEMDKTQYQETVHKKVLDQLKRIDLVLEESQRLHQCDPINFDSLIDGNVYFSTLSRQALEAAKDEVASQSKAFKCCKKINWIYPTIGLTLIGSVILCKTFRF